MRTIGLIANFKKEQADDSVRRVASLAAGMGFSVVAEARAASANPAIRECPLASFKAQGVESVVVLGGDGTMLDASHKLAGQHLPMMGLNIGSLGYLTSVEECQFGDALQQLREDRYDVSLRTALSLSVLHGGGAKVSLPDALNDAVISRGSSGRAVELELLLDGHSVSTFLCDGIIVATPTGSTAYSLSAGGPILLPDAQALVVSMICPHALTSRPLVVKDSTKITLRAVDCDSPMIVSSDGRDNEPLHAEDRVEISRSPHNVPVIELRGYNPCDVLRRKLRWGGR